MNILGAFELAAWAYENRADLDLIQAKAMPIMEVARPLVDLVKAERELFQPAFERLAASFPLVRERKKPTMRWMQDALRHANIPIVVDGKMGPDTHAAIEKFQQAHGLHVDGWAGPETCAVLESYLPL